MQARERTVTLLALGVLSAAFLSFAAAYSGRAVNNVWGDIDLGGWSAVLGHRLLAGERLYRELVVASPPGAMLVLATIERVAGGGPRLLHEIWVCAMSCLVLSWLAFAIARPFVGRDNALFVAGGTLAWVCGSSRELASDCLAHVAAYAVVAVFVHAATEVDDRRARRRFATAGALAGVAVLFEQHTGFGALAAVLVGAGCLAAVEPREPGRLRARGLEALAAGGGAALTVAAGVALVSALHGSPFGFLRAVFVDGPRLKGGPGFLVRNAVHDLSLDPIVRMSLAHIVALVGIATLAVSRHGRDGLGALAVGGAADVGVRARPGIGTAAGAIGVASAAMVWAAVILVTDSEGSALMPRLAVIAFGVVQSGAVLAVALGCVGVRPGSRGALGRAYGATAIATLTIAIAVSASQATFAPLGQANPTIVVVLCAVFLSLELAGLGGLRPLALAMLVAVPLSSKLPRCLLATTRVDASFLDGVRVNDGARDVAKAARRVRELTSEHDTVLVLPEDPMLVGWIGRPRPALCGGIVFLDQYPDRCRAADLEYLARHPPKVVVTRPTDPKDWAKPFKSFGRLAPAELVIVGFILTNVAAYARDSHYRTGWPGDPGAADLDVWVRR